jgi:hypothetical protein
LIIILGVAMFTVVVLALVADPGRQKRGWSPAATSRS